MVLDPQGRIERFNRACEQLTGRAEADVRGHRPTELVAEHDRDVVSSHVREREAPADFPIAFEYRVDHRERTSTALIAWLRTRACSSQDGAIAHVVGREGRHRHHRAAPGGARAGDRGVARQVRVPGQHEPRDPHAAQRRDRHARAAAGHRARRPSSASTRARPRCRATRCSASSTTCSTSRRSRPASSSSTSTTSTCARSSRTRASMLAHQAHAKGLELTALGSTSRCRRSCAATAGACARCCSTCCRTRSSSPRPARCRCASARRRLDGDDRAAARPRSRDTGIGIAPDADRRAVRAVPQEDTLDHAALRRHRARARDLAPARGADGRRADRRRRSRARAARSASPRAFGVSHAERPTRRPRATLPGGPADPRRRRQPRPTARSCAATSSRACTRCDEAESAAGRARAHAQPPPAPASPTSWSCSTSTCRSMDGIELAQAIRKAPSLRAARLVMLTSTATHRADAARGADRRAT